MNALQETLNENMSSSADLIDGCYGALVLIITVIFSNKNKNKTAPLKSLLLLSALALAQ